MPYSITIQLEEKEIRSEDVKRIAIYLAEVLDRMGYSYSIDCVKDGMKVMMGLESPKGEESQSE